MMSVPLRLPVVLGVNVTDTLQLWPDPRELPQVVEDAAKSPLALMPEMVIKACPLLVKVTVLAALVVPTV